MDFKNTQKTYSFFTDFGVGASTILKISQKFGLNAQSRKNFLKSKQKNKLLKQLNNVLKGKLLRNRIHEFENFYKKIKLDTSKKRV